MPEAKDGYQPSEEEIRNAEEMMSDKEKLESRKREQYAKFNIESRERFEPNIDVTAEESFLNGEMSKLPFKSKVNVEVDSKHSLANVLNHEQPDFNGFWQSSGEIKTIQGEKWGKTGKYMVLHRFPERMDYNEDDIKQLRLYGVEATPREKIEREETE